MGEVQPFRSEELRTRDSIGILTCGNVLGNDVLHSLGQGYVGTGLTAENVIQHIYCKFILILRHQHLITALLQIICRCSCSNLQRCDCISLFVCTTSSQLLIFKGNKETAGSCFTGTDAVNELQIVLL